MDDYNIRMGTFIDHGNGIIESIVKEEVDITVDDVDE